MAVLSRFIRVAARLSIIAPVAAITMQAAVWQLDNSFHPVMEASTADAIAVSPTALPDGSVLVVGSYSVVNGKRSALVSHLLADGTLDMLYHAPDQVQPLAADPDSNIIAVRSASDAMQPSVVYRLRPNGAIDPDFQPVTLLDATKVKAHLQADGRILLFGDFSSADGWPSPDIVRLKVDGTIDPTFSSPFSKEAEPVINDAGEQSDGKVVIVGGIVVDSQNSSMARLNADGSIDDQFPVAAIPAQQSSGVQVKVLPSGQILSIDSRGLVRLEADGTIDPTYNPPAQTNWIAAGMPGTSGCVYYVEVADNNAVLGRLKPDGTIDPGFSISTPNGATYQVGLPATWDETTFYIGSALTAERASARQLLSKVDASAKLVDGFIPRFSAEAVITFAARTSSGDYFVSADTDYVNGAKVGDGTSVLKIKTDGTVDTSYMPPSGITPVAAEPDGHLAVTGTFDGGNNTARLAPDGSVAAAFARPSGYYVFTDDGAGRIYVTGPGSVLTRYLPDGSFDDTYWPTIHGLPDVVGAVPDGSLYVNDTGFELVHLSADGKSESIIPSGLSAQYFFLMPDYSLSGLYFNGPTATASASITFTDTRSQPVYNYITPSVDPLAVAGVVYDRMQAAGMTGAVAIKTVYPLGGDIYFPRWMEVQSDGQLTIVRGTDPGHRDQIQRYVHVPGSGPSVPLAPSSVSLTASPSEVVTAGGSISFYATVSGEPPFTYTWMHNGHLLNRNGLSGGGASIHFITFGDTDAGTYSVVVSNKWGSMASAPVYLAVAGAPAIFQDPVNQSVRSGQPATFSVRAAQASSMKYQWQTLLPGAASWSDLADGQDYAGTTKSSLILGAADAAQDGQQFRCIVTNSIGRPTTSDAATLTVRSATDYAGTYFGGLVEGNGRWALRVESDNTGWLIASLPDRGSIVVSRAAVSGDGVVTASGTELVARTTSYKYGVDFSLTGRIAIDGRMVGWMSGVDETLGGAEDPATPQGGVEGLFDGDAGSATGNVFLVVAPSGQALAVSTAGATVDALSGTLDTTGLMNGTTIGGGLLQLKSSDDRQTFSAAFTPLGASTAVAYDSVAALSLSAPTITTQPAGTSATSGGSASFTVVAGGEGPLTYQWYKGGIAIAGATDATLTLPYVYPSDAGDYTVTVSNEGGAVTSSAAALAVSTGTSRLVNSSVRVFVGRGESAAVQNFTIEGTTPREVLLRAVGPTLTGQGVGGVLVDPRLTLYDASGTVIAANDDWGSNANVGDIVTASARLGATPLMSNDTKSAALLVTLAPGTYTARIDGADNGTGIALAEFYEADSQAPITYLAVRGFVGVSSNVLIGGFVVTGTDPALVLVRGLGPALAAEGVPGALEDPTLTIVNALQSNATIPGSDDWGSASTAPDIAAASAAVGLTKLADGSKDAAVLVTLKPGVYSFLLSGKAGTSGIGQVEIAQLDTPAAGSMSPALTAPLANRSVSVHDTVTWTAPYIGRPTGATFQWMKAVDGTAQPIAGATAQTLTLNSVGIGDAGDYSVRIANAAGATATAAATLQVAKLEQTIYFPAIADQVYGDAAVTLAATASSKLSVTYAVVDGPGRIENGNTVVLTGAGEVTVSASQEGDDVYATASTTRSFKVAKAKLVATADDQSRVYGAANPTLTVSYTGFLNGDTSAVLTSVAAATTVADANSLPGTYAIDLSGGEADNYTLELQGGTLNVTPRDYSGGYFGTFSDGSGHWALKVDADGAGTFIAYLPERQSAIVVHVTIDETGAFSVDGTEIVPTSTGRTAQAVGAEKGATAHAAAVASDFTLSGRIMTDQTVTGALAGLNVNLSGTQDTKTGNTGFYEATALGTATGSIYAIVGPSGQAVVVAASGGGVDGASGTVGPAGQISATTAGGAELVASINAQTQKLSVAVTSPGAAQPIDYAGLGDGVVAIKRLVNISTRALAGTGNDVTIGGFVVRGTGPKNFLIRGVGPTLTGLGIKPEEVMLDPTVEVHDALHQNRVIATNDDWSESANSVAIVTLADQLGAQSLAPNDTKSSALLLSLDPGVYSFIVKGKGDTSGVVLLEVYDADPSNGASKIVNISSRAKAAAGNGVAIGGFVVDGNAPKQLLVRAVGPTLATQGLDVAEVLADPTIEVHDALHGNAVIATNDNWGDNPNATDIVATAARLGATPLALTDTTSSSLLITLQPGVYSFVAKGKNGGTGIVLVEVYDAD